MSLSEQRNTIGPYQVQEVLGHGGMATVYRALQPELDRTVAIKVLLPAYLHDAGFRARFQREARLIARLRHPHIVGIYDVADDEGVPYLVMEYLEGGTLHAALVERRHAGQVFSPRETLQLFKPLADALDYAHSRDVIHRDLKPENIILTPGGPVITDFGLAKLTQEETPAISVVMGTPAYMAPEQIEAQPIDPRTDVYAMGILLYELLTGSVPFSGPSPVAVAQAHLSQQPPSLASLNPRLRLPPQVEEVVYRAVAKRKEDRWSSAGAMVAALDRAVGNPAPFTEQETQAVGHMAPPARPAQPVMPRTPARLQRPPDTDSRVSRLALLVPLAALLLGGIWGVRTLTSPGTQTNQEDRPAAVVASAQPSVTTEPSSTQALATASGEISLTTTGTPEASVPAIDATATLGATSVPIASPTLSTVSVDAPVATPDNRVRAVVVAPLGAYLRSGPGTAYPTIGGVGNSVNLTALNQADGWLEVVADSGERGWIARELLELENGDVAALPRPEVAPPPPTATPPAPPQPAPPQPAPTTPPQPAPTTPPQPTSPPPVPAPAPPTTLPPAPPAVAGATVRLEDTDFVGGFRNSGASIYGGRSTTWVYGQGTGYSAMNATFNVGEPRSGTAVLLIEGMDSEDAAKTLVRIAINGVTLFEGSTPFPNDDLPYETGRWATQQLPFDAGILRVGANTVTLTNLSAGRPSLPPFVAVDYAVVRLP